MKVVTSMIMTILLMLGAVSVERVAHAYPEYADQWPHRSIIYFAPSNDEYVKQFLLETLQNECALHDRDVVTLVFTQDGFSVPLWAKDEFELGYLFLHYDIEPEMHTTILIGKDGTEKLRWGRETDWQELKEVIDAMPMRQKEMEDRVSLCSI